MKLARATTTFAILLAAVLSLSYSRAAHAVTGFQLDLAANDLVYEPTTNTIYASVPSRAGVNGNSLIPIDPVTGTAGTAVFLGSEPGRMAISDNGQFIFAALNGAAAVRRFDVAGAFADIQFSLGSDPFFGPIFAEDLATMPGNPDAIAISLRYASVSPRHAGVAVFDAGVPRATRTPGHTGSNRIQFSALPDTLYGINNETTEFGIRRMAIDASGVTVTNTYGGLGGSFSVDIRFDNGLLYLTSGRVVDPEAGTLVGTFTGVPPGALVAPDSSVGRVFFAAGSTIMAFDAATFVLVGTETIPGLTGTPTSLIRWGEDGLAVATTGDQVFVVRSGLIPPAAAPRARTAHRR